MEPNISPLGDQGLLLDWGNQLELARQRAVQRAWRQLQAAALPGVQDLIPAYSSLAVLIDPLYFIRQYPGQLPYLLLRDWVLEALAAAPPSEVPLAATQTWSIPVCFEAPYALDLEELAAAKGLTPAELVAQFCRATYQVYLLGFLPGFPYLGTLSAQLATPRRALPRTLIPAGSVGIAGVQTGIYPLDSPGGWQIIGRTPWRMFVPEQHPPVFLAVGDQVQFYPIAGTEFEPLRATPPVPVPHHDAQ